MTSRELNFLQSAEGKLLLERYDNYDDDALFHLLLKSDKHPIPFLAAAVTLLKLRRRAAGKFHRSADMFFTPRGLEQATGENIARIIAARYQPDWQVADLTCGLGGNLIFLAKQCQHVLAVDKDEVNLAAARANAAVYGVLDKIEFINGEAREEISGRSALKGVNAFFLDPGRDRAGKSKTRSILNSQPPLIETLEQIFALTKNVGVKISPAFDYSELALLPETPEVEIISENNTNKVAMLWFGELKSTARRATIISGAGSYSYTDKNAKHPHLSEAPLTYLYEPNKALTKAHLINEVAEEYGLSQINPHLSFLSGWQLVGADQPGLFRSFKVLAYEAFSWVRLREFIRARRLERLNIMSKRFPLKPEEIYKKLRIKEGGDLFLIFTVFSDEKRYYILAERL